MNTNRMCSRCIGVAGTAVLAGGMALAQMGTAANPATPGAAQNSTTNGGAAGAQRPMQDSMGGQNTMGAMGGMTADKKFVKTAMAGGMAEVQLGQLASQKASSDAVKKFGQQMVDDHTKMNDEMKPVAQKLNVPVPTHLDPKDQALYGKLQAMSGTEFDTAYVRAMVKDHKKDEADFKMEASNGSDPDVKQLASKGEPIISQHLQMIQDIAKSNNVASK